MVEHQQAYLPLLQLCLLLGCAWLLGEGMRRLGQPAVLGELLAGILLGPSLLGTLAPELQQTVFPADSPMLAGLAWLGVLMLLVVTGLEMDLRLILRKTGAAMGISVGGMVVPFAFGLGVGWVLPATLLGNPSERWVFSLFLAVAMSISAIPVIAKVLADLKLLRRDLGQVILASAMVDDTAGWILLSVVAGLAAGGTASTSSVAAACTVAVVFVGLSLLLGRPLMARLLAFVDGRFQGPLPQLSAILVVALAASALSQRLGLEAPLGAFLVGLAAGEAPRLRPQTVHVLELCTAAFLAPLFFASAGLKVQLGQLSDPTILSLGLLVLVAACLGKFLGCYVGGWAAGLGHWERLAVGSGMNARGAMGIIVASMGLQLAVLTPASYTIIVLVAVVTSLMAPPMLTATLARVPVSPDEAARLERSHSFLSTLHRVLLPSRGGTNAQLAASLMACVAARHPLETKVLFAGPAPDERAIESVVDRFRQQGSTPPRSQTVRTVDPASAILAEAARGYDLVCLGASGDPPGPETLFNELADRVLQQSSCPTLVVKAVEGMSFHSPRRILVPTVGTRSSLHAVELACLLAPAVTLVHVMRPGSWLEGGKGQGWLREIAEQVLERQAHRARELGVEVDTLLLDDPVPEEAICRLAAGERFDLIVVGTGLRPLSSRAFLGPRVEAVLTRSPIPVAVLGHPL